MFPDKINIKNEIIPIFLNKSINRKRTLSFKITDLWLTIKSPLKINETKVYEILIKRSEWIHKNWIKQINLKNDLINHSKSESFFYKWEICNAESIKSYGFTDFNYSDLNVWYKKQASQFLISETNNLAQINNLKLNNIYIKKYKRKYWQCKWNDIFLNYEIIKLPVQLIKHIILHELSHLKHKNHSKKFWDFLKSLDKDFLINKKSLNEKGWFILNS